MKIKYQSEYKTVVEFAPTLRTVFCGKRGDTSDETAYRLSLPYLIFIIGHRKCDIPGWGRDEYHYHDLPMLFFRKEPLKSFKDMLYYTKFPNVGYIGHPGVICGPSYSPTKTIDELVEDIIGNFWQSKFTYMLDDQHKPAVPKRLFSEWQKETKKNPECWKNLKFVDPKLLSDLVRKDTPTVLDLAYF